MEKYQRHSESGSILSDGYDDSKNVQFSTKWFKYSYSNLVSEEDGMDFLQLGKKKGRSGIKTLILDIFYDIKVKLEVQQSVSYRTGLGSMTFLRT